MEVLLPSLKEEEEESSRVGVEWRDAVAWKPRGAGGAVGVMQTLLPASKPVKARLNSCR